MYNLARWLTGSNHDAEDLVQDAYVRAWKGFNSFQQGTNFRAWMFRILRNTFLNSRTRKSATPHLSIEEEGEETVLPPVTQTPESTLIDASRHEQLQAALERLPLAYREVILLCDVEELRYQQIADLIGVPVGTVMSRISRGRKLLRGMLAEERLGMRR
jgi:RNA polymerase sigma-70 factor (ECF subfamily)